MNMKLNINYFLLVGRNFDEYCKMFELDDVGKENAILDVASGVSSFCAEANSSGYNVTATDKIYNLELGEIERKAIIDLEIAISKYPSTVEKYKWEIFKTIYELKQQREIAYKKFISDFKENKNKTYINIDYPYCNFKENEFDIALVSHFLFLYDDHLNYEFHKNVIMKLLKAVKKEIRIFPLVNLKCQKSPFVAQLMKDKAFKNFDKQIKKVDYEFVKNGDEMLIIKAVENKKCVKKCVDTENQESNEN